MPTSHNAVHGKWVRMFARLKNQKTQKERLQVIASQIFSETKAWLWGNIRYILYASEKKREREGERERGREESRTKVLQIFDSHFSSINNQVSLSH